jgi:hypothetical protein
MALKPQTWLVRSVIVLWWLLVDSGKTSTFQQGREAFPVITEIVSISWKPLPSENAPKPLFIAGQILLCIPIKVGTLDNQDPSGLQNAKPLFQ